MKISELTLETIANHLREMPDNLDENDKSLIEAMLTASIDYCKGFTGLTAEELDSFEDTTIAVLALVSDMWDNRSMTVDKANTNRVVDTILSMHCTNLVPEVENE